MNVERIAMNNITTNIANMEEERKLAYEKIENLDKSLHRSRKLLNVETSQLATLRKNVWRSKDKGVIEMREEVIALSFEEVSRNSKPETCKITMNVEVDGTKYDIPSSLGDDVPSFMKVFKGWEKKRLIKTYSTEWYKIKGELDRLSGKKAAIKRNVWKSTDPKIIELRELLLFTMKLSK